MTDEELSKEVRNIDLFELKCCENQLNSYNKLISGYIDELIEYRDNILNTEKDNKTNLKIKISQLDKAVCNSMTLQESIKELRVKLDLEEDDYI